MIMFDVVYCEFLKLKHLKIIQTILVCTVIPLILSHSCSYYNNSIVLNNYFEMIINVNSITFSILFLLVSCIIFLDEYKNNTLKNVFCYPLSRVKIFIAKIITVFLIIIVVNLLSLALSLISLLWVKHQPLTAELLIRVIESYMITIFGFICSVPLCSTICIFTEKFTTSLICGMGYIMCLFVFQFIEIKSKFIYFLPIINSLYISLEVLIKGKISVEMLQLTCIGLMASLVIGFMFSILIYKSKDVR